MSWTKEDQAKLREYQTAMMTVKEIAQKMGKPKEFICAELEAMGYRPIESKPKAESDFLNGFKTVEIPKRTRRKVTPEVEKQVCELREKRFTFKQIADKLNIGSEQTVLNVLKRNGYPTGRGQYHKIIPDKSKPSQINQDFEAAVNEMIAEMKEEKAVNAKEKEPAPVATVTDSDDTIRKVSLDNNNIIPPKCQSLTGVKMVGVLEDLLHELYDESVEITSLNADTERCEIRFEQKGTAYWINFGAMQELPVYNGGEVRK